MKKISKTKNKIKKSTSVRKITGFRKSYESHYLAIILVAFLLLEGFLGTTTSLHDWQSGISVFDISSSVSQTAAGLAAVFQPVTNTIDGVNEFYSLAATEMTGLVDLSGSSDSFGQISMIYDGVNDFYQQASVAMASMMDVSSVSSWPARVAGVSITAP